MVRELKNRLLHLLARFLPGATSTRVLLHRLRGVQIKGRVFIGADVYIDDYRPQDIEINDGAVIQTRSILISHMKGRGKIIIGRNAFIGPNAVILKNITIGEAAVIMAGSVVTKNVPPFTMVGGVPAVPLGKLSHHLGLGGDLKKFRLGVRPITKT